MKLYCHSAVKRCMSNRWFQISYIVLYRERYEMITCKLILRYSASVLSSYFNVFHSLCDFHFFFCRLNQISYDILYTSLSFFTLLRTRRNSWSIASPASPAPWSSTSPGPMLQIWHPRGTRKPWNSSSVVTAFLGTSLGCLKLIYKCS